MTCAGELLARLASGVGDIPSIGTVQTDLFEGFLPPKDPATCVSLAVSGGYSRNEQGTASFEADSGFDIYRLQLFSRAAATTSLAAGVRAEARALAAYRSFALVSNVALSGTFYARVEPQQPPYLLDRDDLGRVVFSFNLIAWRRAVQSSDFSAFL